MSVNYFVKRRRLLSEKTNGNLVLIPSSTSVYKNGSMPYHFRQDSDFYYLTNFDEPDSLLLLFEGQSYLFVPPLDPDKERWNGKRLGEQKASEELSIDFSFKNEEIDKIIKNKFLKVETVYYDFSKKKHIEKMIGSEFETIFREKKTCFKNLKNDLTKQRLVKDELEINELRKSNEISSKAHKLAMSFCRPGKFENQLQGIIEGYFKFAGAKGYAYPSIVAGGENATIYHYWQNDKKLNDNELVLIDAGSEWNYYSADITRTFPINGKFNKVQKEVYQSVLKAMKKAIDLAKPGVKLNDIHQEALKSLVEDLIGFGILSTSLEEAIEKKLYHSYFAHSTSHFLGLDTHDLGFGKDSVLESGNVITIEPGLYFEDNLKNIGQEFLGLGIRIEDDILITDQGHENLSFDCPKTLEDVEQYCNTPIESLLDA